MSDFPDAQDDGLTLEEAIAVFDGLSPAILAKADFILDVFIQCEAAEEERKSQN